jgi:hypothetical protein
MHGITTQKITTDIFCDENLKSQSLFLFQISAVAEENCGKPSVDSWPSKK